MSQQRERPANSPTRSRPLEEAGIDVELRTAVDGESAASMLEGMGDEELARCGVMLLDLNMPRMDGPAVLRWLHERPRFARLPVIVLTSSSVPSDRDDCLAAGATQYWIKPQHYAEFVHMAGRLSTFVTA